MRGELKSTLAMYANTVQSVVFSPDGNTLATAGTGGIILLMEAWHYRGAAVVGSGCER